MSESVQDKVWWMIWDDLLEQRYRQVKDGLIGYILDNTMHKIDEIEIVSSIEDEL